MLRIRCQEALELRDRPLDLRKAILLLAEASARGRHDVAVRSLARPPNPLVLRDRRLSRKAPLRVEGPRRLQHRKHADGGVAPLRIHPRRLEALDCLGRTAQVACQVGGRAVGAAHRGGWRPLCGRLAALGVIGVVGLKRDAPLHCVDGLAHGLPRGTPACELRARLALCTPRRPLLGRPLEAREVRILVLTRIIIALLVAVLARRLCHAIKVERAPSAGLGACDQVPGRRPRRLLGQRRGHDRRLGGGRRRWQRRRQRHDRIVRQPGEAVERVRPVGAAVRGDDPRWRPVATQVDWRVAVRRHPFGLRSNRTGRQGRRRA